MKLKKTWTRLLSLVMAVAVLSSVSAMALETDPTLEEVKASVADVRITQDYNGEGVSAEKRVHDYRTDGEKVNIKYFADLNMTSDMAMYLQARQANLMDAQFTVHVKMDMENLEFVDDTVKVFFSSTFLKPAEGVNAKLVDYKGGVFTYQITMPKSAVKADKMDIDMELIVYADGEKGIACGYAEAAENYLDQPQMYHDFELKDWMHTITLEFANMKVKDGVSKKVTTQNSIEIKASGTVDGDFSYISDPADTIKDLVIHKGLGYFQKVDFGKTGSDLDAWQSNTVVVELMRSKISGGGDGPSNLNTKDHYSYIIGYKDGLLRPYGTITRGEVATIFFRLLTDEAREKYWCQSNDYTDVPLELWCNNAISTLSNMGIIDGFQDGSFRPYGKITRAQFSKMAVGFFETNKADFKPYFSDVVEDAWYAEYVTAAVNAGIIQGFQDGTFRPNTSITRAQTCVIVNRVLNRAPEEDHLLPEREMLMWPDNTPDMWFYADMQEATNSHDYKWVATGEKDENGKKIKIEEWTEKLGQRDWAALEHAWSDAHSAHGGGEVVKP